jgi:flagella basal body P-ring formation protein FlgA
LTRDQTITAEDICVIKKWVKCLPDKIATVPDEVIGKALTVNIRQNNEIARNVLKEPRLVKKGNVVQILLDNGEFTITTMGISQENGISEALIRVKNVSSNKIIYARVVNDSLVKVDF